MKESRHFLLDKFCEDIQLKADLLYNLWFQNLRSDLQLCFGDNERLHIINTQRNEIRNKLDGSIHKVFITINDYKNDLTRKIESYFEINLLTKIKLVAFDQSVEFGQYKMDYETGLFTLKGYADFDSTEQPFNFSILEKHSPLAQHLAWCESFLKLKKLNAKITGKILSDQKRKIQKMDLEVVENNLYGNYDRIKARKAEFQQPDISGFINFLGANRRKFSQSNNDNLVQVRLTENTITEPEKESTHGSLKKHKTTIDFLIGNDSEKKYLLEFLKKIYSGTKGKSIALMIHALSENKLIAYVERSELYLALRVDFSEIGSAAGINKYWTEVQLKDKEFQKLITLHKKRIQDFLENLH